MSADAEQIQTLIQNNKLDDARIALKTLKSKDPDSATTHLLTGEIDEKSGDIDGALGELGVSLEKDPSNAVTHFYYAISLYDAGQFEDALAHEMKSNELAPTAADQPLLALLYYAVKNYKQAEVMARKVLSSDAKDEIALEVLAGVAYHGASTEHGNWPEYAGQLASVNPDNFWVYLSHGYDALKQSQIENAKVAFSAAEKRGFPDAAPYFILAGIYVTQSDFGQANDQIKTGLAAIPNDAQLLREGIFISLTTRDNTEASRRFEALKQSYPGTNETAWAGCLYYYGIGEAASALPYCAQQVEQTPNDHIAHSNYGWAALDANQFQLAFQEFSQAYKLVSPNLNQLPETQVVDLSWGLIICFYETGDKNQTVAFLQFIRQSYPAAATVTGLQQLPLLWSATTMSRIETILQAYPK